MVPSFIEIIDKQSQTVLYRFSLEETTLAFKKAQECVEEFDLDIELKLPTITETLGRGLRLSEEQLALLEKSAIDELSDHEGIENCHPCLTDHNK
jgi:hypothetical protein